MLPPATMVSICRAAFLPSAGWPYFFTKYWRSCSVSGYASASAQPLAE
jgi:hypothetical protein